MMYIPAAPIFHLIKWAVLELFTQMILMLRSVLSGTVLVVDLFLCQKPVSDLPVINCHERKPYWVCVL